MSYQEQGENINKELINLFNSIPINQFTATQREHILNIFLRAGQVIKFRCRNNSAYDNFMAICFKNIAEVKRVKANEGDEWATLRAFYGGKDENI